MFIPHLMVHMYVCSDERPKPWFPPYPLLTYNCPPSPTNPLNQWGQDRTGMTAIMCRSLDN